MMLEWRIRFFAAVERWGFRHRCRLYNLYQTSQSCKMITTISPSPRARVRYLPPSAKQTTRGERRPPSPE
jgi:hypothetical protein